MQLLELRLLLHSQGLNLRVEQVAHGFELLRFPGHDPARLLCDRSNTSGADRLTTDISEQQSGSGVLVEGVWRVHVSVGLRSAPRSGGLPLVLVSRHF